MKEDEPKPEQHRTTEDVLKFLEDSSKTLPFMGTPSLQQTIEAAKKGRFELAGDYFDHYISVLKSEPVPIDPEHKVNRKQILDELITLRNALPH